VSIARPSSRGGEALEERVPFAGVRKRIAERMSQSKNTAAHFTFVEECDVTALKALRERMKPEGRGAGREAHLPALHREGHGGGAEASPHSQQRARREHERAGLPQVLQPRHRGLVRGGAGGAGGEERGPSQLLDVAQEIERLGADVKVGKLKVDDLQGSTFTITSLGAQGGLFATPIINFPEVGILGVHQIKQKPVVRDGQIVIGDVMLLSLSFDHRIVDGHVGAAFAYEIINLLQDPDALLLDI
jgi:pyruvate dehydrogenase E2 component (dihydrolipoamide acetyltransferase)